MKKPVLICILLAVPALLAFGGNSHSLIQNIDLTPRHVLGNDHGGPSALDSTGDVLRMINVPVPSPTDLGVSIGLTCDGILYYTNFLVPELYKIDAMGTLLDSVPIHNSAGAPVLIDEIVWDPNRQLFWGVEDVTFGIYLVDPLTGLATFQFTGLVQDTTIRVNDGLALDPADGTIWHSPDVSDSIGHFTTSGVYLGSLIPLGPTGSPDRDISGIIVGNNNQMFVGHDGQGRISVVNKFTGAWISDLVTLPARVQGMECDAVNFAPLTAVWVRNGLNNTLLAIEVDSGACGCTVAQDSCSFPYTQVDLGDLSACNYPTLADNPAHGLSGVAWLGSCVSGDSTPHPLNADLCDDGVSFLNVPWTPCAVETVQVVITSGPNYSRYQGCGGQLYLNAWKDGNINGTFCDEIACVGSVASEWIIQDMLVQPGQYTIPVLDPGVYDLGRYTGVFRVRLTSHPAGRYGFGLVSTACPEMSCGTFGLDSVGEVEDYSIPDFQLAVQLHSFTAQPADEAIALEWVTASESANDHFEVLRDRQVIARIATQGNDRVTHMYRYTDGGLSNGSLYTYTLVAVGVNGSRTEIGTAAAVPDLDQGTVTDYALRQNYPNPFNPSTEISYDLKEAGWVSLKLYNLLGEEVAAMVNKNMAAGRHTVTFNAAALPTGVYIYRLKVNDFTADKKMLLMK